MYIFLYTFLLNIFSPLFIGFISDFCSFLLSSALPVCLREMKRAVDVLLLLGCTNAAWRAEVVLLRQLLGSTDRAHLDRVTVPVSVLAE